MDYEKFINDNNNFENRRDGIFEGKNGILGTSIHQIIKDVVNYNNPKRNSI